MTIYQKIKNTNEVPPGMYRYTCPETGYKIAGEHSKEGLFARVELHYKDNNIPLPGDWKERVEDQMCKQLPTGWCNYSDEDSGYGFTPDLSFDKVLKGITSLSSMVFAALKGEEIFVDGNEANQRAEICTRCFYNMSTSFCGACNAGNVIAETVSKVKGGRSTPSDDDLKNCGICGCKNEAIVHIKKNLLLSGEKAEITEKRPAWCWMKNDNITQAKSQLKI
jgi:hypothetical protein